MKHVALMFLTFTISTASYAQFQVSASSGYAISSAGMKLGETVNISETENYLW